ncbi:MAG TPA: hypothetical protein VK906_05605 [Egicoccus sp.]|nr:hypothetical protein [Egicoccus sp.]HSK22626.1 hypothetical protein [Egicoccus sp.]
MRAVRSAAWLFAAALLLGIAGVSAPVFLSLTGDDVLREGLARYGERPAALRIAVTGTAPPVAASGADRLLREHLNARGLPEPQRTVVVHGASVTVDDHPVRVNLVARDGLVEHLPDAVAAGDGPVAVTAGTAARLRLQPGEQVTLIGGIADLDVDLGPIVADFDHYDMPEFWAPLTFLISADDDLTTPAPLPALLMDVDTMFALVAALDHGDAAPPGARARVPGSAHDRLAISSTWELPLGDVASLEAARRLADPVRELQREALDRSTEIGGALDAASAYGFRRSAPQVGGQLVPAIERAEAELDVLGRPVRGLGRAGEVIALLVVAVAAVRAQRGRLTRARLFAVRGVSPAALAVRAAAAAVLPIALGVGAAWAVGLLLPRVLGLADGVGDDLLRALGRDAPVAVGVALLVVAVVVGVTAAVRARPTAGERRLSPVIEVAAVALALAAWWGREQGGGRPVLERADGTAAVDVVAFALPLLLVVAAAAVGARLLRWSLAVATGLADRTDTAWRWRGGAYLAFRRLRRLTAVSTLLVFVTASGVGLLVVGGVLAASSDATIREKAGITTGGDARLQVHRGELNDAEAMAFYTSLPVPSTLVRRIGDGLLDDRREVEVLAVDPREFPTVAHRPRSLERSLDDLLDDLAPPVAGGTAEVIAVGDTIRDGMVLHLPGLELPVRVVHRVPAFPGVPGERPAVVLANGGVLDPEDVVMRARLLPVTRTELWIGRGDGTVGDLRERMADFGLLEHLEWADDLHDSPAVAPVRATFAFVRGQAAVIAALGLAALLAHHLGLARERALSAALAGRMGMARRSLAAADAVELGAMVAGAIVLGLGSGLLAARTVVADYDPLPAVPLPMVFEVPLAELAPVVSIGALALTATVWLARRSARRADIAAMLREAA